MNPVIDGIHISTSIARYCRRFNISSHGLKPHEIVESAEGISLSKDEACLRIHSLTRFDKDPEKTLARREKARLYSKPSLALNGKPAISLTDQRLPIFGDDDDNLSDLMRMAETQKEVTIDAMRMRELVMELRRIRKELRTRNG